MPNYPKVTGETVFAKDPLDGKVKLLDTIIQLLRTADSAEVTNRQNAIEALNTALSEFEAAINQDISNLESAINDVDTSNMYAKNADLIPSSNNSYDLGSSSRYFNTAFITYAYINELRKTLLPYYDNNYALGSASYQWSNVYSRAMQIGREGYEWDINTNDGYLTLASGLMIEWGYFSQGSSSSSETMTVTFPKAFPSKCVFAYGEQVSNYDGGRDSDYRGFPVQALSKTTFKFQRYDGRPQYWFALGY